MICFKKIPCLSGSAYSHRMVRVLPGPALSPVWLLFTLCNVYFVTHFQKPRLEQLPSFNSQESSTET